MSIAAPFVFKRRFFPFCPSEYDIDALAPADYSCRQAFIRDLTIEDAMALYWSLETVRFQFNASGVFSTIVSQSISADITFSATTPKTPNKRVCNSGTPSSATFTGSGTEVNGVTSIVGGVTTYSDYDITLNLPLALSGGSFPTGPATPVTVQLDGLYTVWCLIDASSALIDLGSYGAANSPPKVDLGGTDVSVGSGFISLRAQANVNYTSGGSVGTIDFVPTYYTY